MHIERHLSFIRDGNARQMLIAQQKLLNVVDDFAGVEDGDGFDHSSEREVFQQQVVDLRHLLRRGQRTKQPHQIVIPLAGDQRVERNPRHAGDVRVQRADYRQYVVAHKYRLLGFIARQHRIIAGDDVNLQRLRNTGAQ